jgi:hypothetical protein
MLRAILLTTFMILAGLPCWAQDSLPDPRIAERLACLKKPARKPNFPALHAYDDSKGFLRFKLRFESPRQAPKIEVLQALAEGRMQELAFDYLSDFRLPCLQPGDPAVEAVQEFYFSGAPEPDALASASAYAAEKCVVMPRDALAYMPLMDTGPANVIAQVTFDGGPEDPPALKLVFSTASARADEAVKEYIGRYRMPCRMGGEAPYTFEQSFAFRMGRSHAVFKNKEVGLVEFLRLVRNAHLLDANFDLNTMACPFAVSFSPRQPKLPNAVREVGAQDPNRTAFLHWLSTLQLAFKNTRQADDLFDSTLIVNVPCGAVRLSPTPKPGASS